MFISRIAGAPDLSRLPITVNRRAISLAEGVRAGLSVAFLIAVSEYLHEPLLREAALAALLTCICDTAGPIRRRVPVLIGFTLVGAAIAFAFGLLRNFGPVVALPLGVAGIFTATFLRIFGQAPQQLGAVTSTVMILALDRGEPGILPAVLTAIAFIGGGVWATLLTMVIWRIYPFRPARRAVADAYGQLAALAGDLGTLARRPTVTDAAWDAHARVHRRRCREAIEAARAAVMSTLKARGAANSRAAQAVIRLEAVDQIFGGLIALSDVLEHASPSERAVTARLLRRMRPVLKLLGHVIAEDEAQSHNRIAAALTRMMQDHAGLPPDSPVRPVIDRILERLCIAQTLAVPANITPGVDSAGQALPLRDQILRPLRANLTWTSPALRHAVRAAVTAAPALALTMVWFTPYDHWLTITIVATMQPYFSATYTRAVERIVGTTLGGLVAAAVGLVCTTPVSMGVGMFVLSVIGFAVRSVNFGLFMLGLTPMVVLLVETGAPETHEWTIAAARAGLTALGGIVAVAANMTLWPWREPQLIAPQVQGTLAAHAAYADADFALLLGEQADADAARRAAGVSSNQLEALITGALLDPGRRDTAALEAAMAIDAALRRFAGRLATLQHGADWHVAPDVLRAWRDWTSHSLRLLAQGQNTLPPRPAATTDTLSRIARQIELIGGAMERLA